MNTNVFSRVFGCKISQTREQMERAGWQAANCVRPSANLAASWWWLDNRILVNLGLGLLGVRSIISIFLLQHFSSSGSRGWDRLHIPAVSRETGIHPGHISRHPSIHQTPLPLFRIWTGLNHLLDSKSSSRFWQLPWGLPPYGACFSTGLQCCCWNTADEFSKACTS